MVVVAPLLLGAMIAASLTVFYGVFLDADRRVVEMRRIFAWHLVRWPWPLHGALPGMFPFGLGGLIALVGRALSGRTVTLEGFPADPGQDLLLVGLAVILVAFWFMLRAPRRVLPVWYRDVIDRRRAGQDPSMPPPRSGASPTLTRRQRRQFFAVCIGLIVATYVLSWPASVASGAFFGLAILTTYAIRER